MTAQQQQSWLERSPDLQSYRKLLRQEFYAPRDLGVKSTESLASSQPKTSLIPIQQASKDSQALRLNEIHLPRWHSPWELYRVVSGHLGWVRCVALDPTNQWFSTGSTDRTIKIWDLASGQLKLTLTGHIHSVRGLAISARSPYLFSVGEDKAVKCWDLEQNKVVRNYHGHLSGVYSCALHPTLDVLATAGADSTTRVWDIRTKAAIHVLVGHTSPVAVVRCQAGEPQVITGSHDSTIRLWDLAAGKTRAVLTNHKKSVRALEFHPAQYTFVSGSPDNIKIWQCPDGTFLRNASGHDAIIQSLAVNADGVLVSGGRLSNTGFLYIESRIGRFFVLLGLGNWIQLSTREFPSPTGISGI
jgi:WD40 repeat protein